MVEHLSSYTVFFTTLNFVRYFNNFNYVL